VYGPFSSQNGWHAVMGGMFEAVNMVLQYHVVAGTVLSDIVQQGSEQAHEVKKGYVPPEIIRNGYTNTVGGDGVISMSLEKNPVSSRSNPH